MPIASGRCREATYREGQQPACRFVLVLFAGGVPFATIAADAPLPATKVRMEECIQAALKARQGDVIRVELTQERGVPIYAFDIEAPDGSKAWDIECDANTGKIVEVEEEVEINDKRFKDLAKISEDQARRTATQKHPGEIVAVEYELEPNGSASYEFDIRQKDGNHMKVEVDVQSGAIVEAHPKFLELGSERTQAKAQKSDQERVGQR